MPEYSKTDIKQQITIEESIQLCEFANNIRDKALISLMNIIPVRPAELTKLNRSDFKLIRNEETTKPYKIEFNIETKKLKKKFYPKRYFEIVYGNVPNIFFQSIWKYVSSKKEDEPIFNFTKRRIRQIVDTIGLKVLNRHLCPYAFRHSTLTRLAKEGKGIEDLMYYKGSGDITSISPYLHGRKQSIKIKKEE